MLVWIWKPAHFALKNLFSHFLYIKIQPIWLPWIESILFPPFKTVSFAVVHTDHVQNSEIFCLKRSLSADPITIAVLVPFLEPAYNIQTHLWLKPEDLKAPFLWLKKKRKLNAGKNIYFLASTTDSWLKGFPSNANLSHYHCIHEIHHNFSGGA